METLLSLIHTYIDERNDTDQTTLSQQLRKLFNKRQPSKLVQQLLKEQPSAEALKATHALLLLQQEKSCIKSMATTVFFMQLLLESPEPCTQERIKLVLPLLTTTSCKAETDFWIGALLKAINPYISTNPVLMAPLWKSICDSASSCAMPLDLTHSCVTALMVYVEEGARQCQSAAQQQQPVQQVQFHSKVLCFLLTRLSTLIPIYLTAKDSEEDDDDHDLEKQILKLLISIRGHATQNDVLDKKVTLCLNKILLDEHKTMHSGRMLRFLNQEEEAPSKAWHHGGKLALLQSVLDQQAASPASELLLTVVEQCLFAYLPHCPGSLSLLVKSSLAVACKFPSTKTYLLLLLWLHRCRHPVTREALVSLIHSYCCIASASSSPTSSLTMLQLLAQLVMDVRTNTTHRRHVASVIHRLLSTPLVEKAMQSALLNQVYKMASSRKRKLSAWTFSDWVCILNINCRLDYASHDGMQGLVKNVESELDNRDDSSTQARCLFHLDQGPLALALVFSGAPSSLLLKVVAWFLTQTKKRRRRNKELSTKACILTYSVLLFLQRSSSATPMAPLVQILAWTVKESKRLMPEETGIVLVMQVASMLQSIPAEPHVETVCKCYHDIFALHQWPITAHLMSSLETFAQNLPRQHQHHLPKCLPVEACQELFKCRLQGKLLGGSSRTSAHVVQKRLAKLIPIVPVRSSPFQKSRSVMQLAPGSLFLSRPVQEGTGREAIVFFPPGPQSLADIKYMLGAETEEVDIRIVERMRVDSGECQIFSTKYEQMK